MREHFSPVSFQWPCSAAWKDESSSLWNVEMKTFAHSLWFLCLLRCSRPYRNTAGIYPSNLIYGKGIHTPVVLPGESHGQRSLAGYSPWGHRELDTTEQLTLHFICGHGDPFTNYMLKIVSEYATTKQDFLSLFSVICKRKFWKPRYSIVPALYDRAGF